MIQSKEELIVLIGFPIFVVISVWLIYLWAGWGYRREQRNLKQEEIYKITIGKSTMTHNMLEEGK
jgi:hypothetical protein